MDDIREMSETSGKRRKLSLPSGGHHMSEAASIPSYTTMSRFAQPFSPPSRGHGNYSPECDVNGEYAVNPRRERRETRNNIGSYDVEGPRSKHQPMDAGSLSSRSPLNYREHSGDDHPYISERHAVGDLPVSAPALTSEKHGKASHGHVQTHSSESAQRSWDFSHLQTPNSILPNVSSDRRNQYTVDPEGNGEYIRSKGGSMPYGKNNEPNSFLYYSRDSRPGYDNMANHYNAQNYSPDAYQQNHQSSERERYPRQDRTEFEHRNYFLHAGRHHHEENYHEEYGQTSYHHYRSDQHAPNAFEGVSSITHKENSYYQAHTHNGDGGPPSDVYREGGRMSEILPQAALPGFPTLGDSNNPYHYQPGSSSSGHSGLPRIRSRSLTGHDREEHSEGPDTESSRFHHGAEAAYSQWVSSYSRGHDDSGHTADPTARRSSMSDTTYSVANREHHFREPYTPYNHHSLRNNDSYLGYQHAAIRGGFSSAVPRQKERKSRESWSAEEHEKFIEGLEKHGRDWHKIQAFVPSKTATQVRAHAYVHFAKVAKGTPPLQVGNQGSDAAGNIRATEAEDKSSSDIDSVTATTAGIPSATLLKKSSSTISSSASTVLSESQSDPAPPSSSSLLGRASDLSNQDDGATPELGSNADNAGSPAASPQPESLKNPAVPSFSPSENDTVKLSRPVHTQPPPRVTEDITSRQERDLS